MAKELLNQKLDLVIDKLMNLDAPDADMDKGTSREDQEKGLVARDFGIKEWDWPQGVGLYGFLELQKARNNTKYDAFLFDWVKNNIAIGLPSKNINTSAPFLTLFDLTGRYDLPEWEQLCREHADWLVNGLPRTKDGGFEHLTSKIGDRNDVWRHEEQMWVDTLFMAVLFLGKMGVRYKNKVWINEAIHQFQLHIEYLYEKKTGLLYHGWSFLENGNFGNVFCCRGNSWFSYGAPAFLVSMGNQMEECDRQFILKVWKNQMAALKKLQAPEGLWYTVLDDDTSYVETSGSGAIAAGMLLGIREGLLDESYLPTAMKAVEALINYIEEDGTVGMVSAGTSVGYDAGHYKDIMIRPMAYGQSLTALALTEALYVAE